MADSCWDLTENRKILQINYPLAPYSSTLAWQIPWTEEPGFSYRNIKITLPTPTRLLAGLNEKTTPLKVKHFILINNGIECNDWTLKSWSRLASEPKSDNLNLKLWASFLWSLNLSLLSWKMSHNSFFAKFMKVKNWHRSSLVAKW